MSSIVGEKKRRSVINGQSREIIYSVFKYLDSTKKEGVTLEDIKHQTSQATGKNIL